MEEGSFSTADIVEMDGQLYSVGHYVKGSAYRSLTPVEQAEGGRMFIQTGRPRRFALTTIKSKARRVASFQYEQLKD